MKKFNIKLLKKVLSIQSDHDDKDMMEYIKKFLGSIKQSYTTDGYGNIYVKKGSDVDYYPCVVCHTDTVIKKIENFSIHQIGKNIVGFNDNTGLQHGIGGDDKVGVFVCLELLKEIDNIKVVFFRHEEGGCKGSNYSSYNELKFYDDCSYILQCDRFGNSDFVLEASGIDLCSNDFKKDVSEVYKEHGYKSAKGISTDVVTLVRNKVGISCANISCGYYRHHTDSEMVDIEDVQDCLSLVTDILNTLKNKRYEHIYKYTSSTYYSAASEFNRSALPLSNNILDSVDVVVDSNSRYDKFRVTGSINSITSYALKSKEPLLLGGSCCPVCGKSKTLHFVDSSMAYIYCTSCCKPLPKDDFIEVIKNTEIRDNSKSFVYASLSKSWFDKDDVMYSDYYNAYYRKH